jgi:hypothetical protein
MAGKGFGFHNCPRHVHGSKIQPFLGLLVLGNRPGLNVSELLVTKGSILDGRLTELVPH